MGYTGARVGQALSQGFAGIGDALYQAAANAERRKMYETEKAEDQRRYDDMIKFRDTQYADIQTRYGEELEQDEQERQAELARQVVTKLEGVYGPGTVQSIPERSGSLVGQGGRPIAGTEVTSPADYLVNPENYDPTQSARYREAEAIGGLEQTELENRTKFMAGQGLTYGGSRLQGADSGTSRAEQILVGGRYFPDTPDGQRDALAWQADLRAAGDTMTAEERMMESILAGLGGERNDAGPQPLIPSGRGQASAQAVASPDQAEWDAAYQAGLARGMSPEEITKPHARGGIGPRPGG